MSHKPIESFRERGVSAAIFRNATREGDDSFYTATVERTYQDPDTGDYKQSSSFRENELIALATVALQARAKIRQLQFQRDKTDVNGA